MKKMFKSLVCCLVLTMFCVSPLYADGVRVIDLFQGSTTINNSYKESRAIDISQKSGYFSLSYIFTTATTHADARVTIDYYVSSTGVAGSWSRSTSGYNIATDVHEGSGTDSNGIDTISFSPVVTKYLKIRVTETATHDAVITCYLNDL